MTEMKVSTTKTHSSKKKKKRERKEKVKKRKASENKIIRNDTFKDINDVIISCQSTALCLYMRGKKKKKKMKGLKKWGLCMTSSGFRCYVRHVHSNKMKKKRRGKNRGKEKKRI